MANHKERVCEQYANAEAMFVEPAKELGQRLPTSSGGWKIYNAPGLGALVLGQGGSEPAAWQDAWRKIDAAMDCDPTVVDE